MDATPAGAYKNILLVEDEAFIADLYAHILRRNGFEVTCAYDGDKGLQLAQSQPFDLILLDLMLPGKSGIDVLEALRDPAISPSFDQSTAIYVLTNFEEDDITKKKLLSMAQAYLVKVYVTPQTLATMIKATPKGSTPETPPARPLG